MKKVVSFLLAICTIICGFNVVSYASNGETLFNQIPKSYQITPVNETSEEAVMERAIGCNVSNGIQPFASTYEYIGTKSYWGVVRKYDYDVYLNTMTYYCMTGLRVTPIIYHTKGSGSKTLTFTIAQEYKSETASNFSVGCGMQAGSSDAINACVNLGYGITKTYSFSVSVSGSVQATIPSNASTGYYQMQILYNFYDAKIIQKKTNGDVVNEYHIGIPYGTAYTAVLYSPTNQGGSTWSRY